jgi:acyl dehydratase
MAISPDSVGRTYSSSEPYEVSRVKIREFADAIGEASPLCRDREAARAVGYPDVIAPPTFPIVVTTAGSLRVTSDPEVGVNYAMVVHGEQSFEHSRPLHAGDVVMWESVIESVRQVRGMTMLTTATQIRTTDGEHVCTARSTLVERGSQQGE